MISLLQKDLLTHQNTLNILHQTTTPQISKQILHLTTHPPFPHNFFDRKCIGMSFLPSGERLCMKKIHFASPSYDPERFDWDKRARPNQRIPDGDWHTWIILAGRGFGKTRTGAESIRQWVDQGTYKHIALLGQTIDEVRHVMVEGISGILAVYPPNDTNRPIFEPSKRKISWPNGATALLFGADHYEWLRGPQFDLAWVDEFAKFNHPQESYDQLMLGLRLGHHPRCIITTTPRPLPVLRDIMDETTTVVTRGTTFENTQNLSPAFLSYVQKRFGQGPLGRQELYAEWIENTEGALWTRESILYKQPDTPLTRVVVGVDPAVTGSGDETGIVIVGRNDRGEAFVLDDASEALHPHDWARRVVQKFHQHQADRIVAEVNQGGDLVEETVRSFDANIPFTPVHATRGKAVRAEPISALYEQGRVFHSHPFPKLEDQMCHFNPDKSTSSPDRMDALVWALTDLFKREEPLTLPKLWWLKG